MNDVTLEAKREAVKAAFEEARTLRKRMNQSRYVRIQVVLIAGLIALCFLSTLLIALANGHLAEEYAAKYTLTDAVHQFEDASDYLTSELQFYTISGDSTHLDNYNYELNTACNREAAIAAMKATYGDPYGGIEDEDLALIEEIYAYSNDVLAPMESEAMALISEGRQGAARTILYGEEYETARNTLNERIDLLRASVIAATEHGVAAQSTFVSVMTGVTYIAQGLTLVIMLVFAVKLTTTVIRPILRITQKVRELSTGDLSGEFDVEPDSSEIGRTVEAIQNLQNFQRSIIGDMNYLLSEMADGNFDIDTRIGDAAYVGEYQTMLTSIRSLNRRLSSTLTSIHQAVEQVSTGSQQVSDGSQALAQGTTQQASAVEELAATIDDMSQQITTNAQNAELGSELSLEARKEVDASSQYMAQLMTAMEEISNTSGQINKIIKTIDDIAFQTNILALNAAVEAARAGAAGKGFAVVADEVRSLAGKSAEAANSTTTLIESAVNAISNGMSIATETANSLNAVVEKTTVVNEKIHEISNVSNAQANAVQQISSGIEQISAVVQTNSATAQESAAASEELSSQAAMVEDLLGQFHLRLDGELVVDPAVSTSAHTETAPYLPTSRPAVRSQSSAAPSFSGKY